MKWYILDLGRVVGGPWGGKFAAKTGGDEVNGDRGPHNKPKTKREETEEEKVAVRRLRKTHFWADL